MPFGGPLVFIGGVEAADARDGNECVGRAFASAADELIGMKPEVVKEAFELPLHGVHLFPHIEDDLNACEVYPEVPGQG